MGFNIKGAQHGGGSRQLLPTLRIGRDRDRAGLDKAGGLAGFFLQIGVEVDGVFREPRQVLSVERGAHQTSRVPCRAAGQFFAFQQHNVFHAKFAEMIGRGAANNTASHNDNRRVCG